MFDAMGSIGVGALMGGVSFFIIAKNRRLLGQSVPDSKEQVVELLLNDEAVMRYILLPLLSTSFLITVFSLYLFFLLSVAYSLSLSTSYLYSTLYHSITLTHSLSLTHYFSLSHSLSLSLSHSHTHILSHLLALSYSFSVSYFSCQDVKAVKIRPGVSRFKAEIQFNPTT